MSDDLAEGPFERKLRARVGDHAFYFEVPTADACWAPFGDMRCKLPKGHDGQHHAEQGTEESGRWYSAWWR